jgi:hypothetical protein
MAEGVSVTCSSGSAESVRGSVGFVRSDDILSNTSMTACRRVAAAVDETTDTRESCSLKQSKRAYDRFSFERSRGPV